MDQNNNENVENTTNTQPLNEILNQTQQVEQPQINSEQALSQTAPINVQPQYIAVQSNSIPEDYKPISMWGYFGYEILFSIPLVGFILLLVFSFGGTRNINLRNFARSYFCFLIVGLIIFGIVLLFMLLLGGAAGLNSASSNAAEATRQIY